MRMRTRRTYMWMRASDRVSSAGYFIHLFIHSCSIEGKDFERDEGTPY